MKNYNYAVEGAVQNPENNNMGADNAPIFEIKTLHKKSTRLINTGNYQNVSIETGLEVTCDNKDLEAVSLMVEEYINSDLDRQEAIIREKLAQEETAKEEARIQQSRELEERYRRIPVYEWQMSTKNGETITLSNDPHYQMTCPRCGGRLEKRTGKFGDFYGCSNYNTTHCGFGVNVQAVTDFINQAVEIVETNQVQEPEKLYGFMTDNNSVIIQTDRAQGQQAAVNDFEPITAPSNAENNEEVLLTVNNYKGVSNFPFKVPYKNGQILCPECGKPMALRKGKTGEFYGCTNYPNCKKTLNKYDVEQAIKDQTAPHYTLMSPPEELVDAELPF